MEWAEDLKQTLKKTVKKGRRAAGESTSSANSNKPNSGSASTPEQEKLSFDKDFLDDDSDNLDFKSALIKAKGKSGGWADEAIKSGSGKSSKGKPNLIEMERFNPITSQSIDDDIPVIPDMDDIQDELVLQELAEAPAVSINRVETYKELNSELLNHSAFTTLEDVDLSILTKCLQNETVLEEPDVVWTWEKLFTEVTAEIHADKPKSADVTADYIN